MYVAELFREEEQRALTSLKHLRRSKAVSNLKGGGQMGGQLVWKKGPGCRQDGRTRSNGGSPACVDSTAYMQQQQQQRKYTIITRTIEAGTTLPHSILPLFAALLINNPLTQPIRSTAPKPKLLSPTSGPLPTLYNLCNLSTTPSSALFAA